MRVTFELPGPLVKQLRSLVSNGKRSQFVADLIEKKLRTKSSALEYAARKANGLAKVNADMKNWQPSMGVEISGRFDD